MIKLQKRALNISIALLALCTAYLNDTATAQDGAHTERNASVPHLKIYTHRDTFFAQFPENKPAQGIVPELMHCAANKMQFTYEFVIAPLSRSRNLINAQEHILWFPSTHQGDPERMRRLIGPVGDLNSYWYQLKSSTLDPHSEEFKTKARVTAYTKSTFAEELQESGYNWVSGSADYNRLIYMLMTNRVDAMLAVDFHRALNKDTQILFEKHTRRTLDKSVKVSIQVSRYMYKNEPQFVNILDSTIHTCLGK
ncbi:hypothetical protein [Kordiimonas aquimaris]|uniref:hypothetical protein n=1 Tax=Kordiimonas aquimaris TaxID=707591 RepID=UPI0021D26919|nr:hypothetical protein [Kordiimonas aquimaris]